MNKQVLKLADNLKLLGLSPDATLSEIRAQYHKLAKTWHPDLHHADAELRARAEEEIRRINAAFNDIELCLSNVESFSSGSEPLLDSQAQREFSNSGLGQDAGSRINFGRVAEIIAWPFELLYGVVKALIYFPLAVVTELPGVILYLGVFVTSIAMAAVIIAGINYCRSGEVIIPFITAPSAMVQNDQLREDLNNWAQRKRETPLDQSRTIAPEKSAIEAAPQIIVSVLDCNLVAVSRILSTDSRAAFAVDSKGDTALAWAAKRGCSDLIDPLLSAGARVDSRAENGLSPIDWAVRYGHKDIVQRLAQAR